MTKIEGNSADRLTGQEDKSRRKIEVKGNHSTHFLDAKFGSGSEIKSKILEDFSAAKWGVSKQSDIIELIKLAVWKDLQGERKKGENS